MPSFIVGGELRQGDLGDRRGIKPSGCWAKLRVIYDTLFHRKIAIGVPQHISSYAAGHAGDPTGAVERGPTLNVVTPLHCQPPSIVREKRLPECAKNGRI